MRILSRFACTTALLLGLTACAGNTLGSLGTTSASLFQQLGGMNTVLQLTDVFLQSSGKNPQLSGLLAGSNNNQLSNQVANQLCASLGGGCQAPLTQSQIRAGAQKLTGGQQQAISDQLDKSLQQTITSSLAREAASQLLGPQIGGIVGALL